VYSRSVEIVLTSAGTSCDLKSRLEVKCLVRLFGDEADTTDAMIKSTPVKNTPRAFCLPGPSRWSAEYLHT